MSLPSFLLCLILSILSLFSSGFISDAFASTDVTNSWSNSLAIPIPVASSVTFNSNNKIFLIGGANTSDFPNIWTSNVGTGSLSNWDNQSYSLPQARFWSALAEQGTGKYLLGGASLENSPMYLSSVLLGRVDESGMIISWLPQAPLPDNLGMGAAAIIGDRIYFSGGFKGSYVSNKVYSAPINPDGSLGTWIEAGEMPEQRFGHGMIAYNNHLIILGGYDNSSTLNSVYFVTPDSTGHISSWTMTESLPSSAYRASTVLKGSTILTIGGADTNGSTDKVYYATVNDDGTVNPWALSSNHLPSSVHGGAATVAGDYLYLVGGYNSYSDTYLSSVYYTKLNLASETDLSVPLYKQTDLLWKDLEYDSAHLWASSSAITIERWGCALSSAAMVLNYYGIFKLPDGTILNPGTLNTWLKNEKDGYVKSGWLNWQKIAVLSKISKPWNPSFLYDALEFKFGTSSASLLREDLKNNMPDILEEPGHFIVARGISGSSFSINDPFYTKDLLTNYSNSFLSLRRFSPSYSDLSYVFLFSTDDIIVVAKDANGDIVGEGIVQNPLNDSLGKGNNGKPLKTYYIPKPTSGLFKITVSSEVTTSYDLGVYLYDMEGKASISSQKGIVGNEKDDEFTINFDKLQINNAKVSSQFSFDSLIMDLALFYAQKEIKNRGAYNSLREKVIEAKKKSSKEEGDDRRESMEVFIKLLDSFYRKKTITKTAYQILKPEAGYLLDIFDKKYNDDHDDEGHLEDD